MNFYTKFFDNKNFKLKARKFPQKIFPQYNKNKKFY